MGKELPYVTQFCNMEIEWENMKLDLQTASKEQVQALVALHKKAISQSGLEPNELMLISACRKLGIL